uniref:Uncharacterized protein n=1 Tax=Bionectria ochroleuca TaxID=29856 RepID=A0A8H7TU31_BIOOC
MDHNSTMSSDTMPNLFPDRPIRPLPKRRLRERLSPQVAESIKYPPSMLNSVPLFQYPCSSKEEETHSNIAFTGSSGGCNKLSRQKVFQAAEMEGSMEQME